MERRVPDNNIRRVMDAGLPGLENDPWFEERVMQRIRQEEQQQLTSSRPRKLSVALLVALIVVLLTATATAAVIMSMRQLVEEQMVPMAQLSEGDSYTLEQTSIIMKMAQESGITLSEKTLREIAMMGESGEGYYKEEFVMAIFRAEFGENVRTWTLAQQLWFDQVCDAIDWHWETQHAMPEGGEDAKYPVIQHVKAYLAETWGAEGLDDPERYTQEVEYIDGTSDGSYTGNYWGVYYAPHTPQDAEYGVMLDDDWKIIDEWIKPGVTAGMTVDDIYECYHWSNINAVGYSGYDYTWAQSRWRALREDVLAYASDTGSQAYLCMAGTTYPDILPDAMTWQEACVYAAAHLGLEDYSLSEYYHYYLGPIGDEPNPVWKVQVGLPGEPGGWNVEVDCLTGEIRYIREIDNMHLKWWMSFTRWPVVIEVEENWVDPNPPMSFG